MTRWSPNERRPALCVYCDRPMIDHWMYALQQGVKDGYYPCPDSPTIVDVPL